jgi:type I restriction enzyme R subunit
MVMIHKFREDDDTNTPDYFAEAINQNSAKVAESRPEYVVFNPFGVVNNSEKILVLID